MKTEYHTPKAFLRELGSRTKKYRIESMLTQKQLADKAGVSLRSIQRFENGEDLQLSNLFRILEALDLSDNILMLIPDMANRPSAYLPQYKPRQRVRSSEVKKATGKFRWGDEK